MTTTTPKRYVFDLDKSVEERWGPILSDNKQNLIELEKFIDETLTELGITGIIYKIVNFFIVWILQFFIKFNDELVYMAKASKIDYTKIVIVQFLYEAFSGCSSIITRVMNRYVFLRTMDWDVDLLKKFTIELDIRKDGKTICIAPTWVGCAGIFTALVVDNSGYSSYAVAMNYRVTQELGLMTSLKNFLRLLLVRNPTSFLIRDLIQKQCSVEETTKHLQKMWLITPCYFTVFNNENSVVITRDALRSWTKSVPKQTSLTELYDPRNSFLIQTNRDDNYTPTHFDIFVKCAYVAVYIYVALFVFNSSFVMYIIWLLSLLWFVCRCIVLGLRASKNTVLDNKMKDFLESSYGELVKDIVEWKHVSTLNLGLSILSIIFLTGNLFFVNIVTLLIDGLIVCGIIWYSIGTYDENFIHSKERHAMILELIQKHNNGWGSEADLLKDMLQFPVINEETIYTSVIYDSSVRTLVEKSSESKEFSEKKES